MPIYDVVTDKYGVIKREAENIKEARDWAKKALGLGPRCVTVHREFKRCATCDSQPCVCGGTFYNRHED